MSEELDRFMAEKVMGWGYKYKLAIDGEDISYYWLGTRAVLRCDEWHPTKDMNQAMMCLDQWLDDNTDVDRAYSLAVLHDDFAAFTAPTMGITTIKSADSTFTIVPTH